MAAWQALAAELWVLGESGWEPGFGYRVTIATPAPASFVPLTAAAPLWCKSTNL